MVFRYALAFLLLLAFGLLAAGPRPAALAQAPAMVLGGPDDPTALDKGAKLWATRAGCPACHGWAGDGKASLDFPPGANLRQTQLTWDQLVEIIRCGRPATAMPYHARTAYTDDDKCYGMTEAEIGNDKPNPGANLKPGEIRSVATYVEKHLKGLGAVTKDECLAYFGKDSTTCNVY